MDRAREMIQKVRTGVILAEDPSYILSIYIQQVTTAYNSSYRGIQWPLLASKNTVFMCIHTHACMHACVPACAASV